MDVSRELTDRVLRHVYDAEYRPAKPKQIAMAIEAYPDDYREVRRVIKQLTLEGQIVYGSNHIVFPTGNRPASGGLVRGTFRRAMGGQFGFVRLSSPASGAKRNDMAEDCFVPPGYTAGALEGDIVEIELRPGDRGGTEAIVKEIIERARRQFTGTFRLQGKHAVVFLDGTPYTEPVTVGDVRGLPLEDNDKVFVEVVKFPGDGGANGEAVILERLGSSKNPAIDTLTIMRQYGLPDAFDESVIDDARAQADHFDETKLDPDRRDLTELLTITIDPFDARDFDDAISLQRDGRFWKLRVHIADVSYFVPRGSKLDDEALKRATSVYLPDRVIPMLPEIISNHLASLQPERVRLVKTVEIEYDQDLNITHSEVYNAAIRSDMRLNYEQVDQFLASPDVFRESWGNEVCDLLARMHELAMAIRKRRFKRGSLSMDMPDVKLDLDRMGKVKGAHLVAHTESHQIIEEFMLAANQAVATWLDDQELAFLHRIHAPPDRRKLRQLQTFVQDLGLNVGTVESRFEIQSILDQVAGTPLENAVNFAVLKAMTKAVYGPQVEGHYALDMEHYCHFTSPIRRYPDLTVHRLVQNLIEGKPTPDDSYESLFKLGHHTSDMERNAERAERDLIELKLLHFLSKQIGQTLEAVISRVFADGIHARCLKLPVDGYVPIATLPSDKYRFEKHGQMLIGFKDGNRFRLGDSLTVRISKVDLQDRQLYLEVVKNHSVGHTIKGPPKATAGKAIAKPSRQTIRREMKKRRKRNK
jgi:ribonuclease R